MRLKTIILGAAAAIGVAAPAAALAEPYGGHDGGHYAEGARHDGGYRGGYGGGYRDDGGRRDGYRNGDWRERTAWGYGGWGYDGPRCFVENRGFYNWYGAYVSRPERVCR
jgi:hypothetical protein